MEAVIEAKVGIEPPPELAVELFRPLDIRDRNDDRLELHVDFGDVRLAGRLVTTAFLFEICHGFLLCVHLSQKSL